MPVFGQRSLQNLKTCHPKLQDIAHEAIKSYDFIVAVGYRNKRDQDLAVATGKSKTPWPTSRHNSNPSEAMDLVPFPVDWEDLSRFQALAVVVKAAASKLLIPISWGGDWKSWKDWDHFELKR